MTLERYACLLALVPSLGVVAVAQGAPANYVLVPQRCQFVAHLLKGGLAAGLAHDHVVRAKMATGTIRFDPHAPEATQIQVTVPTSSLVADEPALRRRYKLPSKLSAEQQDEVLQNLRGDDQLHVAKFRRMSFRSTAVQQLTGGKLRISGRLEIHGVTRSVGFVARVERPGVDGPDRLLRASASLKLNQSDFGYEPYSAGLGMVRVKDRLTLNIYLVAQRRDGR